MNRENAVKQIKIVAERLAKQGHKRAPELYRIAQMIDNMPPEALDQLMHGNQGGGMGEENPGSGPIQDFNIKEIDPSQADPSMMMDGMGGGGAGGGQQGQIPIESYVHKNERGEQIDDRVIHTLTCTLKAPQDVSEAHMMNYILGIAKELGVDVDSFKWSKSEQAPKIQKIR